MDKETPLAEFPTAVDPPPGVGDGGDVTSGVPFSGQNFEIGTLGWLAGCLGQLCRNFNRNILSDA
jgi:hypothetical protein